MRGRQLTTLINATHICMVCRFFVLCAFVRLTAASSYAVDIPFSSQNTINSNPYNNAESVFLVDVNNDGKLDALTAGAGAIVVWMKPVNSSTNWDQHIIDGTFASANSVFSSDIDGDGDADVLAAASGSTDDVAWWKNINGTGTNWMKGTVDGSFNGARSVSACDIDGDGKMDILACASSSDTVAWWRNINGTGTNWMKISIDTGFDGASSVVGADIDFDGDLDVIGSAETAGKIAWWENNGGAGTNWTPHTIDTSFTGAKSVAVADLDGDGDLDVAGVGLAANQIKWWENVDETGGIWTSHFVSASFNGANAVFIDDLDDDGDPDILASAQTADDVTWFENVNGNGTSWTPHTVDGTFDGARSVYAGDIDGDGDADVTGAAFIEDNFAWWENQTIHRSAVFCTNGIVAAGFDGAQSILSYDLDRDGDDDIIGAASVDKRIAWWENADSQGGVWLERSVATNIQAAWAIFSTDIDGDGRPDILAASGGSNTVSWWRDNDGAGLNWSRIAIDTNFNSANAVSAADIDQDGDQDVVAASTSSGKITYWKNNDGSGTNWTQHVITNSLTQVNAIALSDINGDGRVDVAASAFSPGRIVWLENADASATNWISHSVDTAFNGAMTVTAVDFDRDGDIDLSGASFDLDQLVWWENSDGAGTNWIKHIIDAVVDGASAVHVADLDDDGDLDVMGGSSVVNRFAWWENVDGSNTNWMRHDLALDTLDAADIITGDLNRDGKADIIGASANASGGVDPNILWWKNKGGQFALTGSSFLPLTVAPGSTTLVQSLSFAHRGRNGDSDEELASLSFLFQKNTATPITSAEANNVFQSLSLYRDDGSGTFEPGIDPLAAQVDTLSLSSGVQQFVLTDDDPLFQCSVDSTNIYYVVMDMTTNAGNHSFNQFRLSLLAESTVAEDRDHDLAIEKECSTGTLSGISTIITYADVSIAMTGTPNPLELNSNLTYSITVSNQSVDHAWNVVVTSTLPNLVSFNAAGSDPGCSAGAGVVVCNISAITGHQARVISVAVHVGGNAIGAITNTASVSTYSIDTNLSDNTALTIVSLPDSDMDGDADFNDPDDDNDSMPDYWEIFYGLNRTNSLDAAENKDSDDYNNLDEFIADTIPTNGASFFVVDFIDGTNPVNVYVQSSTGRVYTLQYNDSLVSESWSNVTGQINQPGNGTMFPLLDDASNTNRSYRVNVRLP